MDNEELQKSILDLQKQIDLLQNKSVNQSQVPTAGIKSRHIEEGLLVPVGGMLSYAGSTAPTGFLICDGSEVSRTDYVTLFEVIGETYGAGDGRNTFAIPNLKGKIPVGLNSSESEFDTLGETGGEKTHTLTTAELAIHTHVQDAHGHILHTKNSGSGGSSYIVITAAESTYSNDYNVVNTTAINQNAGSGTPFNVLSPYIVCNYIIKY